MYLTHYTSALRPCYFCTAKVSSGEVARSVGPPPATVNQPILFASLCQITHVPCSWRLHVSATPLTLIAACWHPATRNRLTQDGVVASRLAFQRCPQPVWGERRLLAACCPPRRRLPRPLARLGVLPSTNRTLSAARVGSHASVLSMVRRGTNRHGRAPIG